MELENIFNSVKRVSKKINMENKSVDGLAFWKHIKKILAEEDISASKWKPQNKVLTKYVMTEIPEYQIFGNDKKEIIEHAHFIIQTVRIPMTEKPSLRKIIQIALNIGQCQGFGTKFNKFLVNRTKLSNYISDKDIQEISKKISKQTVDKIDKYLSKF